MLIVFNPSISNDTFFAQEKSISVNQGSSLKAIIEVAPGMGYMLIYTFDFDALFVRSDLYDRFSIKDNSIDAMFMPTWDCRFIQCYDGKTYIEGFKRLIWHGIEFESDEIQLLPRNLRQFNDTQAKKT